MRAVVGRDRGAPLLPLREGDFAGRAASLLELDEWPAAEADLLRAVEIAPQEPAALNYLGYSWAERGLNLDEAFGLIEKAVAIEPNSGAYIDSLGWAHYQLGDYDEAVGHLEHAASLEPADPTITEHLGDVYWRLGRKIEARYEWKRVLELEPPQQMRERVEKKIEQGLAEQDS
ncbi:tetratricopeptide repeat protein [Hyphococcus sp.]|uniref:tetratricopeptide repeat protein n=1 Tax=Hyphococcus sp. TaxID=2038636 RepID=UPI0035C6FDC4